jgi:hypothetical protein
VQLRLGSYDPLQPRFDIAARAALDKKSRLPVAELSQTSGDAFTLVEIEGPAGQPYTLQQFERRQSYRLPPGTWWIDSLHAGHAADRLDATALLVRHAADRDQWVADRALLLDAQRIWRRAFNLTDPATLHLHVTRGGDYRIDAEGVKAQFRIEPFLTHYPADYHHPPTFTSGHVWSLELGYYLLSIQPEQRGTLALTLRSAAGGKVATPLESPQQATARFGMMKVTGDRPYTLYLNEIPETPSTLVVRPVPVDLNRALPVSLQPGEEVAIPVRLPEPGTLQAVKEDGSPLTLKVDAGEWRNAAALAAGDYTVRLRAPREAAAELTLSLAPRRLDPAAPPLPMTARPALPAFPRLTADSPQFFDLGPGDRRTFALQVEQPALYRLETLGLLSTAGSLRTRTEPALAEAQGNGIGHNLLVQQYLGRGRLSAYRRGRGRFAGPRRSAGRG